MLLDAVIDVLNPQSGESYLDLTAGYGGHAASILSKTGDPHKLTLVDRDHNAITSLSHLAEAGATLMHADFASAAAALAEQGEQFDMILVDLGVSSPHLDNAERGFSFQQEAPLDMRMDNRQDLTADEVVNTWPKEELMRILSEYGEEPRSRRIADAITQARPVKTTTQLAGIIEAHYGRRGKTHPATRTFQALRIAVNDELGQLQRTLQYIPDLLTDQGRVGIISFHSLEDRIVKRFFNEEAKAGFEARLRVLTKKPIDGAKDDVLNRRARSAKLRAALKINT